MAINKVIYKGNTLIDLTSDTVTPENLISGVTAHAKNGEVITGTMVPGSGEGGIDTSDATATADEIFKDETAYVNGEKITGTFTIDNELNTQNDLIGQIQTVLQNKATPPSTDTSDATATENDILGGKTAYVKGNKIIGIIPSKETTTYTPSTSNQIITAGTYCSGDQIIQGDSNLISDNIKSGVSIFGVNGIYEGSGGDSGVGSVEICDVKIQCSQEFLEYIGVIYFEMRYLTSDNKIEQIPRYTDDAFIDGAITSADQFLLLENIKCNSMIYINNSYSDISYIEEDNCEEMLYDNMGGVYILIGSAYANQTVTFTFTTDEMMNGGGN